MMQCGHNPYPAEVSTRLAIGKWHWSYQLSTGELYNNLDNNTDVFDVKVLVKICCWCHLGKYFC